jgi:hypothetical protein
VTQVQQIAVTIMRRANLPTKEESRKIEDRLRRAVEKKSPKPQNGMRDGFPPANRESAYRARWGRVVRIRFLTGKGVWVAAAGAVVTVA